MVKSKSFGGYYSPTWSPEGFSQTLPTTTTTRKASTTSATPHNNKSRSPRGEIAEHLELCTAHHRSRSVKSNFFWHCLFHISRFQATTTAFVSCCCCCCCCCLVVILWWMRFWFCRHRPSYFPPLRFLFDFFSVLLLIFFFHIFYPAKSWNNSRLMNRSSEGPMDAILGRTIKVLSVCVCVCACRCVC